MPGLVARIYNAKWLILGIILVALIIWVAWPFLNVIVYGIFIYYVAKPIKRRLRPYIKNDTALVFVSLFLIALPFALVIGYALLLGISEFSSASQSLGIQTTQTTILTNMSAAILNNVSLNTVLSGDFLEMLPQDWVNMISGSSGLFSDIRQLLISTGMTVVELTFKAFIMLIIAFYLIRDDERIKAWFVRTFPHMPDEHDGVLVKYWLAVDDDLEKIFFGNILSIVLLAVIALVVFSLINVFAPAPSFLIPLPLLMGALCGVAALLPIVGMYIVTVPLFVYILIQSVLAGTFMAHIAYFIIMVLAVVLMVQTLPELFLRPFVGCGQINTGLLMFAYILGPMVFGIAGLFIAAILLVLITHYFRIVVPQLSKEHDAIKEQ